MFKPVGSRVSFPTLEEEVLRFWRERDVFRRTESEREGAPLFMFFEGPPTANGSPGIHHVLARIFKDVIPRYKTMKGYRCLRKGGWDTHGLPVELEVEKQLKLTSKRDIEAYGVARFNERCRQSVFRYLEEWEAMTERIGFWVDMKDAYVTLRNDYIETEWWIIQQLWNTTVKDELGQEHRFLYEDFKVTPHCPRCETSLSSHEVALGYKEDTPDPSVYVKFRVLPGQKSPFPDDAPTYLLAWTTTPWTLPGNTALAVAPDAEYSVVELERDGRRERIVLASALVEQVVKGEHTVVHTLAGRDLVGLSYEPLYNPWDCGVDVRQFQSRFSSQLGATLARLEPAQRPDSGGAPAYRAIPSQYVSLEEGTGIVHTAPAFGEEDFRLGREHGLHFVQPVDLRGVVTGAYPFASKFVKQADRDIMADLERRGLLYRREVYRHTYPFCWRCDTPLLYYAKSSWYIRTTAVKERLVSANQEISWYPDYIKEGRFGEWLRGNVDWAISRERYWGTPIPIWRCGCGEAVCIGSRAELKERALPEHRTKVDGLDLHRPFVDEVLLACPKCGGPMRRIPELMDVWFDSGSMPVAQWHYPFENQAIAQDGRYPADYICEAVDQTRGWFYSLHAIATLLERATGKRLTSPSYKNVICLGLILDEQGRKMSKRLGNIVRPADVLAAHGADALRWYLFTASPAGEPRRFSSALVEEVVRRTMLTLWNTYSFFVTYANLDGWRPSQAQGVGPRPVGELDRWILSELNLLVSDVDTHLSSYNPTDAGRRIEEFVELLSNWYVRRSRRRFWKSENDQDKLQAYATLYRCLTTVAQLIAPLTPFVAEEMYRNLVASQDSSAPESVHLSRFPEADRSLMDQRLMEATRLAMRVASLGRAARARAGIRVRQPLAKVTVALRTPEEAPLLDSVREQVLDELNVKALSVARPGEMDQSQQAAAEEGGYAVALDTTITAELADEGLAREMVHRIQNMRKSAGFELMDRIVTTYQAGEVVRRVMASHGDYIRQETLSEALQEGAPADGAYQEKLKLSGEEVVLGVRRVS